MTLYEILEKRIGKRVPFDGEFYTKHGYATYKEVFDVRINPYFGNIEVHSEITFEDGHRATYVSDGVQSLTTEEYEEWRRDGSVIR